MSEEFKWPMPPQFSSPALAGMSTAQDCLIVLNDGQKLVGNLLRFSPDEGRLKFQFTRAPTSVSIKFATPHIKRLIQTRATVTDITSVAMNEGMRSLKQDGLEKILQGLTDINQVRAVSN